MIQGESISAAGCLLPLTTNPDIPKTTGTRHRAALGLTEETDAIAIVVSEQTGIISLVIGGEITRDLDDQTLDSYNELFQNISESDPTTTPLTSPKEGRTGQPLTPPKTHYIEGTEKVVQGNRPQTDKTTIELSKTEDISHETETESLSIQQKEKELIIKALKKNNNKRKYAARDLEISERTLYRKIKQYDLED